MSNLSRIAGILAVIALAIPLLFRVWNELLWVSVILGAAAILTGIFTPRPAVRNWAGKVGIITGIVAVVSAFLAISYIEFDTDGSRLPKPDSITSQLPR